MRLFLLSVSSFTLLSYPALADPAPVPARKPLEARVETNWRYGDERSILMTEFWVPIAQNVQDGSVLYGDLRMMGDDMDNREFNLGLGYRDMVRTALLGEGIAGAHIWFDRRLTDRGSTFNQVTLGGEWLGEEFDILANGYLPLSDEERHFAPNASPQGPELTGTGIFVDTLGTVLEEPQTGLDLELGWQVPAFEDHTDSVRIYGGGYYFDGPNTESVAGWRTRLAADITSDIQVGARFQKDDERGSQGFLEATIRFPFGNKKSFRDEGIRARLDDSPERDIDIVTGDVVSDAGERVQVLNTATGAPQEVLHVDNMAAGGGDGSIENPFNTLADAQAAASAHSVIYVHRGNGTTAGQNAGIALNQTGQQLIGSGTHFTYDGTRFAAANGAAVDPGSLILAAADPAGAPTITNAGGDGITVTADNINVAGITVDGAAGYGILVRNATGNGWNNTKINTITVNNNTFDGIRLQADGAGSIIDSAILSNITANANTNWGVWAQAINGGQIDTVSVDTVTANNNGRVGVRFSAESANTSKINNLRATNVTAQGNSRHGVYLDANMGMINTARLENVTTQGNALHGLYVRTRGGGESDTISIRNVSAQNNTLDGVAVETEDAGSNARNVTVQNATAQNNRHGIYIHGINDGAVSAMIQGAVTTANNQHGIAVYDDTNDTFEVDLGGGSMGSSGNNVLAGNTLEDLAVEYDGRQLSAMHNWWGQAAGPDTDNPGIGIAPQIYYGAPINDGLVGHWTFDNEWTDSTTAYDRSGQGKNGDFVNNPQIVSGINREALSLNSANENVSIVNFAGSASTQLTASLWFRSTASEARFLTSGNTRLHLRLLASNPQIKIFNNSTTFVNSGVSLDDGSLNHLAAIWDGANVSMYLNGAFLNSSAYVDTWQAQNNLDLGTYIYGACPPSCQGTYSGMLDDVRFYNSDLSISQISELYRMDTSSNVNTGSFLTSAP